MTDLGAVVRKTADQLVAKHVGVVVAAVAGGATEVVGAGRTGGGYDGAPDAGTLFEIGSVTKVFTALALARMTVAGTTTLDEPLAALLPEGTAVPSREGREITLRHLATHTSGLPRLPKGMLLPALLRPSTPDPYAGCTSESLLRGLARTRLGAVPGRRFRYSNLGAGLLGLALAQRAGTDYETLVAREICSPLGMKDTGITVDGDRPARLAPGHTGSGRPAGAWHLADLAGAGGLRSTAADMVTFVRAQLEGDTGELAEAVRLSREVEHRISPFSWIHLGWMGQRLHPRQGAHLQLWHNGMTGGFSSFVGFDPEKGVGVVVLSNTKRSADRQAFDLLRTLQQEHS
ncbi:beta-lactamase family protein [Planomonospora sp. ID67723]|uniref:serine hydrolase domain-containing protein n=1 Tax=Planomonospora sp. ID67723 TaxID=2738134 RepID=UPI0018C382CE|nr:serine hydrolase domain-containing protein [Planomonospora sp. ID67723]MBG0830439.1 beta-lactamase family protein [Planomonospora sp. ID67723]